MNLPNDPSRSPRRARLPLAMLAALAMFALTETAHAEDASSHFEQGVSFFKDGDYEGALVEFKRAYELSPDYRVLYNLGQTSRELRDYASALANFERYLTEGGAEIEEARKKRVEGWVTELKPKVARVTLKTNVEGAEVTVDDLGRGKTPLAAPIIVNAGRRKISLSKSGYATVQRVVEIAGTQPLTLELELLPLDAGKPGPVIPPNEDDKPVPGTTTPPIEEDHSPAPWIALAGTGAAGIATALLGGLAVSARGSLDDELNKFPSNAETIEAAREKTKNFALATDIAGGVTIAGAAVTVILFVTEYAGGDSTTATEKAALLPRVGVGPSSFDITVPFAF